MSANVESMFYTRVAPWHGFGVCVQSALSSADAIEKSGLNWNVIQRPIMTDQYTAIPGYKANIRDRDEKVLGVVTDRYKVVQNAEAFAFTDALLGEASAMKPPELCRMARKSGCLPNSRINISLKASKLSRILFSVARMTATAQSR